MSLISVKNLFLPFQKTTHIVTIVLVAGLVGAFRWSGGAISTSAKKNKAIVIEDNYTGEDEVEMVEAEDNQSTRKAVLNEILNKKGQDKDLAQESDSLDEIEKKLGLK
jgi:hypothetical protein